MIVTTQPEKKPDGTVTFQITIPNKEVKEAYEKVVTLAVAETELSGFRKGKAPKDMVIEKIGKKKLYTHVLQHLLPNTYAEAVAEHKLKPISNPKIEAKSLEEDKDWILEVTLAEKPQFDLGNYKKVVSETLAATKIWVPGKAGSAQVNTAGKTQATNHQPSTDEKLNKIFAALITAIPISLPEILVEEQLNHSLSQLIEQLQRLGLTLDQYLVSLGKTSPELRKNYRQQAEEELKLELILNEIGNTLGIAVGDEEIAELIKAVGDEKLQDRLKTPNQRSIIAANLRKRKIIDALLKM